MRTRALFLSVIIWGFLAGIALAQVYIFANGGFTWSQGGT